MTSLTKKSSVISRPWEELKPKFQKKEVVAGEEEQLQNKEVVAGEEQQLQNTEPTTLADIDLSKIDPVAFSQWVSNKRASEDIFTYTGDKKRTAEIMAMPGLTPDQKINIAKNEVRPSIIKMDKVAQRVLTGDGDIGALDNWYKTNIPNPTTQEFDAYRGYRTKINTLAASKLEAEIESNNEIPFNQKEIFNKVLSASKSYEEARGASLNFMSRARADLGYNPSTNTWEKNDQTEIFSLLETEINKDFDADMTAGSSHEAVSSLLWAMSGHVPDYSALGAMETGPDGTTRWVPYVGDDEKWDIKNPEKQRKMWWSRKLGQYTAYKKKQIALDNLFEKGMYEPPPPTQSDESGEQDAGGGNIINWNDLE